VRSGAGGHERWHAAGGVTVVLLGFAVGASYARVEGTFGTAAALVVLGVVVVALVVWRVRRHRRDRTSRAGR
jgi:membrane protein DedA with SNARE-associated domain